MPFSLPEISISPPPPEQPVAEPYSPFSSIVYSNESDGYRPRLLTPPPMPLQRRSRLCSIISNSHSKPNEGLDNERFNALLQASRERNATNGKEPNLRREVALRMHRVKQNERRALFISRVLAAPNATVTDPHMAPDSPPLPDCSPSFSPFSPHSTSISPEIQNDITSCTDDASSDCPSAKRLEASKPLVRQGSMLPSLEEISARMTVQGYVCVPISRQHAAPLRGSTVHCSRNTTSRSKGSALSTVGDGFHVSRRGPEPLVFSDELEPVPFPEMRAAIDPQEHNGSTRASRAHDMLCTLRRRTLALETGYGREISDPNSRWKRHSAPGDLFPLRERMGFQHPVLSMPGGF
ncbi:hypothetical protein AMATHDRAFT_44479 [Amanita thiersii Skay4041]|uniref:Uncharacterized protein n=1 Tax=Amanita thiersii Skay4041 TaxID=703135 RepID=A0A2A9NVS1_9AGAR|nr:hypothetical protein AMATHDRAFT_44479 [Amanita thiersii Skay4041]